MKQRIIELEKEKQNAIKNAEAIVKKSRAYEVEAPFLNKRIEEQEKQLETLQTKNR